MHIVAATSRQARVVVAAAWLCALLGVARPASAYCVAHTCSLESASGEVCLRDAATGCSIGGVPLARASGCIRFAIEAGAAQSSVGLSDAELERAILDAFAAWASVDCGDGSPSIEAQSVGARDVHAPYACTAVPELNVDVWMLSQGLSGRDAVTPTSGATAGVTKPTFIRETGLLFDADVLLNELWFVVQDPDVLAEHLRVVATHEAGHLLGLAHSFDPNALMFRDYRVTADRTLTQDDIDGICALYPPRALRCDSPSAPEAAFSEDACQQASAERMAQDALGRRQAAEQGNGCSVGRVRGGADERGGLAWGWLGLAFGVLVTRQRRRVRLLACGALLLVACEGKAAREQADRAASAATPAATPAATVARSSAAMHDPLVTHLLEVAAACDWTEATRMLRCDQAVDEDLASQILRDDRSRLQALATLAELVASDDVKLRAISARVLSLGFSATLGDGLRAGAVDKAVSAQLTAALRTLPIEDARRIAPATVHAAMLADEAAALHAALGARADRELSRMAYRRLMVHGRLRALREVQAAAASDDGPLAEAALEAPRNMLAWSAEEQGALCPWLLQLLGHAEAPRAARAAQALGNCQGAHVDALLARGHELRALGLLDRARLSAFLHVCKPSQSVTSTQCARTIEFLELLAKDTQSSAQLRMGALSALSYQVTDEAVLERVAAPLVEDADPKLARHARRMLTRAERSADAL